ncbi:MAG: hypothetical protein QM518_16325, partial [Verrucomicrobiota bacterium]|nr:hypothetical protein [Verrucomicrobiota bacterium]
AGLQELAQSDPDPRVRLLAETARGECRFGGLGSVRRRMVWFGMGQITRRNSRRIVSYCERRLERSWHR